MADNVTSFEQQGQQLRAGYTEAATLYQDNLGVLIASGQAMINSCQTMHGALLAFLQSRAKEGLALSQRLVESGSPQNAVEIELDFAREAMQAYADQYARWSKLTGEAFTACAQPFQRRAVELADRAGELAA